MVIPACAGIQARLHVGASLRIPAFSPAGCGKQFCEVEYEQVIYENIRLIRGRRDLQATMLAFVDLRERIPKDHPLRLIKAVH